MRREAFNKIIHRVMVRRGYSGYDAENVFWERFDDLFHNNTTTWRQKIWAQKRGFLSEKIQVYGLTEENYRDYLADFTYQKLLPLDGFFRKWIDDKLSIRYILQPFAEYLPEYYFQITSGKLYILPDAPPGLEASIEGILSLLKDRQDLVLKPTAGSQGLGFYKLHLSGGRYYINDQLVQPQEVRALLANSKDALVTEYLTAHEDIRRFYAHAPNSVRVLVLNATGQDPLVANAYIKFGTVKSGVIDNTHAGGLFAEVDVASGEFNDAFEWEDRKLTRFKIHPDSGEVFSGTLPHWELLKQKLCEIGLYIPQLSYLGYDIVITRDSFKIIEINSRPGIGIQCKRPFLRDNLCKDFFDDRIEKKRRGQ